MAKTKAQKATTLKALKDKFSRAKSVVFSEIKGVPVKHLSQIRRRLRDKEIEYTVTKRTLLKIAAKEAGLPELPEEIYAGTVATAISYGDSILPAKLIHAAMKEAEQLKLLGGIVDGKIVLPKEMKVLALLPGREELLAKLVGSIQSPLYGFVGVLSGILRNFAYGLKAIHDKKSTTP